jgi:hypothetical protein
VRQNIKESIGKPRSHQLPSFSGFTSRDNANFLNHKQCRLPVGSCAFATLELKLKKQPGPHARKIRQVEICGHGTNLLSGNLHFESSA